MEKVKKWKGLFRKKKRIISAIGVGIFMIPVILFLIMESSYNGTGTLAPTPTYMVQQDGKNPYNIQPTNAVVMVSPQKGIPKWKTYAGSTYTMGVPPEWSARPSQVLGGGEVVIVKPDILPDEVNTPEFIFYSNLDASTMQQKVGVLKGLGFTESTVTVLGKSASKFSGTLPSKLVGNQTVKTPIQVTDIYLTQGDKLYVFSYQYDGGEPSKLLEDYFLKDIIGGISLK